MRKIQLSSLAIIAQGSLEPRVFNGQNYYEIGGKWHVFDAPSQQFYQLSDSIISVKINTAATSIQIQNFELLEEGELSAVQETRWANFTFFNSPDSLIYKCESILNNSIIEDIGFGTEAIPLLQANDSLLNTLPVPEQWSIATAEVDRAWDFTTGDSNVVIAIIDNGVNWVKEDFRQATNTTGAFWVNPGEDAWADPNSPGGDGIDNDNNGFIDDWRGWNFAEGNNVVTDAWASPHGTAVTSIAVASTNNNKGMAGVSGGWGSKVGARAMIVKVVDSTGNGLTAAISAHSAIEYAAKNGANVINISYAYHTNKTAISDAIELAYKKYNCVVVAASGNNQLNTPPVRFPASHQLVLGVAATNIQDRTNLSHIGPKLDLAAPGLNLPVITVEPYGLDTSKYSISTGTSLAAPFVSATVALMLSANSCMNSYDVADIIRHRADKVNAESASNPNGYDYGEIPLKPGHSKMIGYGRVNAKRAVAAARAYKEDTVDLYIKDHYSDFGFSNSYSDTSRFDDWSDLWIRNQPDGHLVHKTDTVYFSPGQPNYVYVRVKNKSCQSSGITDSISLYWSKLSLINSWPQNWDGTDTTIGNIIDKIAIPKLQPGQDTILEFSWNIAPEPVRQWGTCIMARINSTTDPIQPYPNKLNDEIRYNNNIAARNLHVFKGSGKKQKVILEGERYAAGINFYAGNVSGQPEPVDIHFDVPYNFNQHHLIHDAEIRIRLGDYTWQLFQASNIEDHQGVEVWGPNTLAITEPHARIRNLYFSPGMRDSIFFGFNYLSEEIDSTLNYRYHITQYIEGEITGSVNFNIERNQREPFSAYAGPDKYTYEGGTVTLQAASIGESAEYHWYNSDKELVHQGQSFAVSPLESATFILQVQADIDLYKDYDSVTVHIYPYAITSISPNPAETSCVVNFDVLGAKNPYLMLTNASNGATVQTVNLSQSQTQTTLNLGSLSNGNYMVVLVCDNQIVDSENLQIQ